MTKLDISKLNIEEFHKLQGHPAFIKINRRVRAVFVPVVNEGDAYSLLELLYTPDTGERLAELETDSDDQN